MTKKMKILDRVKHMGITGKVFLYLGGFVVLILVMLWVFQITFLNSFYRSIKTNAIKSMMQTVVTQLSREDAQSQLQTLSDNKDISIRLIQEDGSNLYQILNDNPGGRMIYKLKEPEIEALRREANQQGGMILRMYQHKPEGEQLPNPGFGQGKPKEPKDNYAKNEYLLCAKEIIMEDNTPLFVVLAAAINPVEATVETLRVQLIWITTIMILLCAGLAFIISRKISTPIIQMNESAKELAHGNYHVNFEAGGYREVSELGTTLNYAAKELATVDNLRKELIANVSHDLRTPLTMITAYSEIMRDLPGENTSENVQVIIDEATRLTALVNDLLDLSKLEARTQQITKQEYNLTESINTILMRYTKLIQNDGYQIHFEYDEEVFIDADEAKMMQVIYNLVNNAINYTGNDKKVVIKQLVKDDLVTIEVIDTGKGIVAQELPYIWERYYKVDKEHKRSAIGTGLGLSIVKGILQMHGAQYGVRSTIGKGSTFYFTMACKRS